MSLRYSRAAALALVSTLALLIARPTTAHHSYSMFDVSKQNSITGTVRNFEWSNPHVWLWIAVMNANNEANLYAFEGTSINEMSRRSGWTRNTVVSGDKVSVKFAPFKDGRNGGRIQAVTLADGRTLDADSGFHPPGPPGSQGSP